MSSPTTEGVLGKIVQHAIDHLEYLPGASELLTVEAICSEVSALCPVTNQPDLYTVAIKYRPSGWIVESKALKLFLWRYRDRGISCEDLAADIARELAEQHPVPTEFTVTARQQSRGGIVLEAIAFAGRGF